MNSARRPDSGFTLLEMVISMAILVFISFGTYQAITQTYKLRDSLSNEEEFHSAIRMSMNVLERDVSLIYSPTLIFQNTNPQPTAGAPPQLDARQQAILSVTDASTVSAFWGPAGDRMGLRFARFQGDDRKLSFISTSNIRVYKDTQESDFVKVSYQINRDEVNKDLPGTSVLTKTESPNAFEIDDSRDRSMRSYALLRGIKSWRFRYYRKDTGRWETAWDSERIDTKNLYPDKIEITLEAIGPQRLAWNGLYILRPEVPWRGLSPTL